MALKKSDLYSSLWASCDELRGGMDASQYKDYVLFMLFIKYISDKYGNKNRLREQDIHRIVDTFTRQTDVPRYARMAPFDEIADAKNDYNLNLPRYIDSTTPEDLQDIDGHLRGGIPEHDLDALAGYWQVIPGVRSTLFSPRPPGEGMGVREKTASYKAQDVMRATQRHLPSEEVSGVGSGLPNVQKTALLAFSFESPVQVPEQTAIATVLSDMDAELSALEAHRDKTRALKQAMMQELLTGRTRLV